LIRGRSGVDSPIAAPTEKKLDLSVLVVTLNEEENLRRCLGSIAEVASEIVVVDSGSSDGTHAVADVFGAQWHHREWSGFRDQKNFALSKCTREWVLALDADEEVTPALLESITTLVSTNPHDLHGGRCARLSQFLGKWIKHGDWYPDSQLRLFRRECTKFEGKAGHDHAVVDGEIADLKGDLLHYSYPTINSYIDKLNSFSDAFTDDRVERGKSWSLAGNVFRPWWRFFRGYIIRRGFLDGFPGYWIAKSTAYSTFLRHSRLYEHAKDKKDA
jgi:glycosyltransferase involved in cell wall biosynthesis